jgi:hypothetical protein
MPALDRRTFLVMSASIVAGARGALAAPQTTTPPPPVPWADAGRVLASIVEIASADWSGHSGVVRDAIAGVRRDGEYLISRWKGTEGKPVPRGYVDGLQADADLLRTAQQTRPLTPPKEKQVLETADDVRLKAQQCQQSKAGWAELVLVSVKTVDRTQQPATGREVWYCPRGWADLESKWQKFPTLSSPTQERIAPGMYMFRIGTGPSEPRRVGGDGLPQAALELIVQR